MTRAEIIEQVRSKASFLCVGLDTDLTKIPESLRGSSDPIFEFNKAIIDATQDLCVSFKVNVAFYEFLGIEGLEAMRRTLEYIPDEHFVIADAKRGDIGNTSTMYAKAFFETYNSDAITLSPYMGEDSIRPFLDFKDKWAIVLALTSNKGAEDFQLQQVGENGRALYELVLERVASWGTRDNTMFVAGATKGEYFKNIRAMVPDHFLLVPGVGAQGGDLHSICENGLNSDVSLLVNSSRGIIYSGHGNDFAKAARQAAGELQAAMEKELRLFGLL
ncbi:MAG: orotidine-5'-phosphate decarboxylase [Vicingaceae bacterium]